MPYHHQPAAGKLNSRLLLRPEQLLTVLDALPGMVGYWNAELRNIFANRAYIEYFGMTPEEMRGVHLRDVLGAEVFAANLPYVQRALAGEEQLFDRTLTDVNGRTRHVQASYVPHTDGDTVQGFVVLVTDVTERAVAERALARSAEQYRALARSLPGGFVMLFDTDLRFLVAEGPELRTFGHSARELEQHTLHEAFSAELAAELEPRYRTALAGGEVVWEHVVLDRTFRLSAAPVRDDAGRVFAGMIVARDISDQRRSEEVWAALHEVATSAARNAAPEKIATLVATRLSRMFNVETAAVVRFMDGSSGQIMAMAPTVPAGLPQVLRFDRDDWSATAQVAKTGLPSVVHYAPSVAGLTGALQTEGLLAGAAAPIRHRGALWGTIAVAAKDADRLSQDMLDRLTSFAELVEIALGNLQAWTTLSEQAAVDSLTELPNRRTFDDELRREIARADRDGGCFTVVVMDIDHFKAINDSFGHPTGDRVLVEVAARLRSVARASETVARTGGEEFGWLLPGADREQALAAAERARHAVADDEFAGVGHVTISLGLCTSTDAAEVAAVVDAADEALYEAKRGGRNRTAYRCRPVTRTPPPAV